MLQRFGTFIGVVIVLALIAGPVIYAYRSQLEMRNFRVVRDGVLYRSGQLSLPALKRVIHDRGIRTVITLRDSYEEGQPPPDLAEEEYCRREGLLHVRISPREWYGADSIAPVDDGLRTFLRVMSDSNNYPVLVHCFAGIHRTGGYCAVFRMEFDGWSNQQAIDEVIANGYYNIHDDWDILEYLEHYRPGLLSRPAPEPKPAPKKNGKRRTPAHD
jgi:protein tyrosine/serine phosphatase